MTEVNLILILSAALLPGTSLGPATRTFADTSLQRGRAAS
jgi:hypothetical protein